MKKIIILLLSVYAFTVSYAQVGINTTNPDPSSALDVVSANTGILIPRMTQVERNAISSPVAGLLVYQTNNTPGFYYFNGTSWSNLSEDNLGNHTATQNVQLNGNYLSGDGGNEGVFVATDGKVGVRTTTPTSDFFVNSTNGYPVVINTNNSRSLLTIRNNSTSTNDIQTGYLIDYYDGSSIVTAAAMYMRSYNETPDVPNLLRIENRVGPIRFSAGGLTFDRMTILTNGNVGIGTTSPTQRLDINGGLVIRAGSITAGQAGFYQTVGELRVYDSTGNITTISPHNFDLLPHGPSEDMAWAFYSERDGKAINVDMGRMARLVEQLSGESLVYLKDVDGNISTTTIAHSLVQQVEDLKQENTDLKKQIDTIQQQLQQLLEEKRK